MNEKNQFALMRELVDAIGPGVNRELCLQSEVVALIATTSLKFFDSLWNAVCIRRRLLFIRILYTTIFDGYIFVRKIRLRGVF